MTRTGMLQKRNEDASRRMNGLMQKKWRGALSVAMIITPQKRSQFSSDPSQYFTRGWIDGRNETRGDRTCSSFAFFSLSNSFLNSV